MAELTPAARRLSIVAGQVSSGIATERAGCRVAVWANGGGERQIVQVLRPLCAELGIELYVQSQVCGALYPQFNEDLFAVQAARLTPEQRSVATQELKQLCATCDVWLGWPQGSWNRVVRIIGGWPARLRWIQTVSAGTDALTAVAPASIQVSRAEGKFDNSIAEWVLTWMFMHSKKVHRFIESQHGKIWRRQFSDISLVASSSVLIVGYGSIGQRIAQLCKALGIRVVGTTRSASIRGMDKAEIMVHPSKDLHSLLPIADFVILCMPLTDETRMSFGAAEIAAMKKGAALINIARGELVDWHEVCGALRRESLAAYYTDVTTPEPLPDGHPDWGVPNLHITPHNTWAPHPDMADDARRFYDNLELFLAGHPLRGLVDRSRGY